MAFSICPRCGRKCETLFRWSYKHPETGLIVKAHKRPFPIPLCSCTKRKS